MIDSRRWHGRPPWTARWSRILVERPTRPLAIAVSSIDAHHVRMMWSEEHERAGTTGIHSGYGVAPPALTGREREQTVLTQCLADLLGGKAPPHDVAMMGPRGNGKTVLLNWFEGACRKRAAHTSCGFRHAEYGPGRTWTTCFCRCQSSTGSCPGSSASPASAKPSGLRQLRRLRICGAAERPLPEKADRRARRRSPHPRP